MVPHTVLHTGSGINLLHTFTQPLLGCMSRWATFRLTYTLLLDRKRWQRGATDGGNCLNLGAKSTDRPNLEPRTIVALLTCLHAVRNR